MIIQQSNDLHIGVPKTRLLYGEDAGTSIIRWENPAGFSPSWAIQVGRSRRRTLLGVGV
jgi:hypothetical protein